MTGCISQSLADALHSLERARQALQDADSLRSQPTAAMHRETAIRELGLAETSVRRVQHLITGVAIRLPSEST